MVSLYAILLTCTIAIPLMLSFDEKVQFYRTWKFVIPAIFLVAILYIIPDIYLTQKGVWGFNPSYHSNVVIFGMPIEEWLFFLIVPYASLFIHYVFFTYFPHAHCTPSVGKILTTILMILGGIVLTFNIHKTYTAYALSMLLFALSITFFDKAGVVNSFYVSFLIILMPFLAINGILTGSFIEEEVVWYNENEFSGIRLFTIPLEDFAYGFSLLLLTLLLATKIAKVVTVNNG